jgi:hypothetical protein
MHIRPGPTLQKMLEHIEGVSGVVRIGKPVFLTFPLDEQMVREIRNFNSEEHRYYRQVETAVVFAAAARPVTGIAHYRALFDTLDPKIHRVDTLLPRQRVEGTNLVVNVGEIFFEEWAGRFFQNSGASIRDPETRARIAAVMNARPERLFDKDGYARIISVKEELLRPVRVLFYPMVGAAERARSEAEARDLPVSSLNTTLIIPLRRGAVTDTTLRTVFPPSSSP